MALTSVLSNRGQHNRVALAQLEHLLADGWSDPAVSFQIEFRLEQDLGGWMFPPGRFCLFSKLSAVDFSTASVTLGNTTTFPLDDAADLPAGGDHSRALAQPSDVFWDVGGLSKNLGWNNTYVRNSQTPC